jgi:hypothetical protein
MKQFYTAPWDVLLILITVIITGVLVAITQVDSITSGLLSGGLIFIAMFFGVYGYRIEEGKLKILRLGWTKEVDLTTIRSVEFKPDAMKRSLRRFGIGGLFSYSGLFSNRELGSYKAYVTHRKKTVLIQTKENELIVVSPGNPDGFVDAVLSITKYPEMSDHPIN